MARNRKPEQIHATALAVMEASQLLEGSRRNGGKELAESAVAAAEVLLADAGLRDSAKEDEKMVEKRTRSWEGSTARKDGDVGEEATSADDAGADDALEDAIVWLGLASDGETGMERGRDTL